MTAEEDYKLMQYGVGFTNMVARPTKGSADLTRKEIKDGAKILLEKIQKYQPKVAVFNGKLIYEVFSGKKDFGFGKQPDTVEGTNTVSFFLTSDTINYINEYIFSTCGLCRHQVLDVLNCRVQLIKCHFMQRLKNLEIT